MKDWEGRKARGKGGRMQGTKEGRKGKGKEKE